MELMVILNVAPARLMVVCLCVAVGCDQRTAAPPPPNIVLIISDDQAYTDFGFMGSPHVLTPNLDELASQSLRFVNAYVPTSVCRPSLATLMTGLYTHQHGIHFNRPPGDDQAPVYEMFQALETLPRLLAQAGYRSLQTGKFWEGHYRNAAFDEGMTLGEPHPIEDTLGLRQRQKNGDAGLAIGRETMTPIYEFVDRQVEAGQPFMVCYAPMLPHTPHTGERRLHELYEGDAGVAPELVAYYATCTWFDETVGELLGYLDRKGIADNTVVVFLADNGWAPRPGEPYRADLRSKWSPYDLGLRTPILIRWTDQVEPRTREELASTVDIVPTLLAVAGMHDKAKGLPGRNLLAGDGQDRAVFGSVYHNRAERLGQPGREVHYRWTRKGAFKLILPGPGRPEAVPMLFDLEADPQERRNLAQDAALAEVRAELEAVLDSWWNP